MADRATTAAPRDFVYIKPSGRRLTEYEALNLYAQPLEFGATTPTAKLAGWSPESTAMRLRSWYDFRDPARMWQRPYTRRQAEQGRAIERTLEAAVASGGTRRIDPEWAGAVLGELYVPYAFFERALSRALMHASLVALSDVVSIALVFNATDKERHAEDILFHQYDLNAAGVPVGDDDRKQLWLADPLLQPMRRLAERINATADWCEVALVTNLVVEPLLGRFACTEVIGAGAAAHKDFVTPVVVIEAENDRQRNIGWTSALVDLLVGDEIHGGANRTLLEDWVGAWFQPVHEALAALAPVCERAGVSFDEARSQVLADWQGLMASHGVASAWMPDLPA